MGQSRHCLKRLDDPKEKTTQTGLRLSRNGGLDFTIFPISIPATKGKKHRV